MELPASGFLMSHAFISYNSRDSEAAGSLTRLLQGLGLRAWWDMDRGHHDQAPRLSFDVRGKPIPGDDRAVESELKSAIAHSILVTVITSPHTLQSVWVRKEIKLACRLQKPLFFWHVIDPEEAEGVSVRHGGAPPSPYLRGEMFARAVIKHYKQEFLASTASIEFMQEFSTLRELNVIGHSISPLSEIDRVCSELNKIIELGELVLHNGEALSADSVQQFWPEYDRLCEYAEKLQRTIHSRFGRQVCAHRTPVAHYFRLKRPYVLTRIRHLERLLGDESFRMGEFRKLDV